MTPLGKGPERTELQSTSHVDAHGHLTGKTERVRPNDAEVLASVKDRGPVTRDEVIGGQAYPASAVTVNPPHEPLGAPPGRRPGWTGHIADVIDHRFPSVQAKDRRWLVQHHVAEGQAAFSDLALGGQFDWRPRRLVLDLGIWPPLDRLDRNANKSGKPDG